VKKEVAGEVGEGVGSVNGRWGRKWDKSGKRKKVAIGKGRMGSRVDKEEDKISNKWT